MADEGSSGAVPMDAQSSSVQANLVGDDSPISAALAEDNESTSAQDSLVSEDNSVSERLAQEDEGTYVEDSGEGEPQDVDGNVEQPQEVQEEAPELEPEVQAEQRQPTQQEWDAKVKNYQEFVGQVVAQTFSQDAVNNFGKEFYRAFGVEVDDLDDYDGTKTGVQESIPKVGQLLSRALVDGTYAALPTLLAARDPNTGQSVLAGVIESQFPGFQEMHSRAMYGSAWEKVRAEHPYGDNLPEYGTADFRELLSAAGKSIKNFDSLGLKDKRGRELPLQQQLSGRYKLLADRIARTGGRRSSSSVTRSSRRPAARPTGDRLADFITESNSRSDF